MKRIRKRGRGEREIPAARLSSYRPPACDIDTYRALNGVLRQPIVLMSIHNGTGERAEESRGAIPRRPKQNMSNLQVDLATQDSDRAEQSAAQQ